MKIKCPVCKGRGTVIDSNDPTVYRQYDYYGYPLFAEKACPKCKGAGFIIRSSK